MHDPEKWNPVFRKDHASTKMPELQSIPLETTAALSRRLPVAQVWESLGQQ